MSGFSSENTMMRRMSSTSSPHTEIARVITGAERACDRCLAHAAASAVRDRAPPERCAVRRAIVSSSLRNFRDDAPAAEHQRAVADALDLLEIGRDQEHRHALLQRQLQQVIDLRLGADVDADRRLLQDEQLDLRLHPAGDDDLLLIAAAERGDRLLGVLGLDREALERRARVWRFRSRRR